MGSRITLKDVAARAGVSRATASLVVRGAGRVSEATRKRVFDTMDELGYVYHRGAAALRSQRTDVVGVLVTDISNPFFAEMTLGLEAELDTRGFVSLLTNTLDDPRRQEHLLTALREHQVAGLVVVPTQGTGAGLIDKLEAWGVTYVLATRYLEDRTTHYVGPDDVRGGELAATHLIERGCRTLAYLGGPVHAVARRDRVRGVRAAAAGKAEVLDLPGETSGRGGREIARQLTEVPDGVICHSDVVAFGVYRELRDRGAAEPLVVGFDGVAEGELWEPPLTSVSAHPRELGRQAAELLTRQLTDPSDAPEVVLIEPQLVVRRSTEGSPPQRAS
ncbi:LacI family DNA-binding transcriptional regulator [Amycolatopsis sp. FDAARGOS 1241]|uniref:LacI family DNA-binding transcriptional regulator n=1 Tax=Amycolatopsis sp. FDAARGOS 1241 TaxID=2778070 RepID=UPI0019513C9C|nr:LacI family DNA-binding transcriptional regulator [Amycolatopsis sp. FDAARGOS 1241]QRP44731.1 LacI family DNA-binding transcriptional regulator [Amycolatopsis sp. FDAARGOS 1241]